MRINEGKFTEKIKHYSVIISVIRALVIVVAGIEVIQAWFKVI